MPRSYRRDASEGSRSAADVLRIVAGRKLAVSSRTLRVASETSVGPPPMMPATATGFSASAITSISGSRMRSTSSSVTRRSPGRARRAITTGPSASASKACCGCPSSSIV